MKTPIGLQCESAVSPCDVDCPAPRFSWFLPVGVQSAWQIEVYTALDHDDTASLLWQSEWVTDPETLDRRYMGPPLAAWTPYGWRVRTRSADGRESPWSERARFATGPLGPDDLHAQWIAREESPRLPSSSWFRNGIRPDPPVDVRSGDEYAGVCLRKEFSVTAPVAGAQLLVCGLGYADVYLDGQRVGDAVMDPPFTNYEKRVCYRVHEITAALSAGRHLLEVELGNGFFRLPTPNLFQHERAAWRATPRLLLELRWRTVDGQTHVVHTDPTWLTALGTRRFNCLYGGEIVDRRRLAGSDAGGTTVPWRPACVVAPPRGVLCRAQVQAMQVEERVPPVTVSPGSDAVLVDFGRNLTGWVELDVSARQDRQITLLSGEHARDGQVIPNGPGSPAGHTYGAFQQDEYFGPTQTAEIAHLRPRFSYHGFRYAEIRGVAADEFTAVAAVQVNTHLPDTGSFHCSDARLERMLAIARRTLLNSAHGMPAEEPTREKMGWSQDNWNCQNAYHSLFFDSRHLYRKAILDFLDAQEPGGHIPPIAPTHGWGCLDDLGGQEFCDDPWWGGCLGLMLDNYLRWHGDRELLETTFAGEMRYVRYLESTAIGGILYWSLGDWLDAAHRWPVGPGLTPVPCTSTIGFLHLLRLTARHARLLGRLEEAAQVEARAREVKRAWQRRFNPTDSQSAAALALQHGLVEAAQQGAVEQALVRRIEHNGGMLETGFLGTLPTISMLTRVAPHLVLPAVIGNQDHGWWWQVENGAGTFGENIHRSGYGSNHHPQGAAIAGWIFQSVLGLAPAADAWAFSRAQVNPGWRLGPEHCRGSVLTRRGPVAVEWNRKGDAVELTVDLPGGIEADIHLPGIVPGSVRGVKESAGTWHGERDLRVVGRCTISAQIVKGCTQ